MKLEAHPGETNRMKQGRLRFLMAFPISTDRRGKFARVYIACRPAVEQPAAVNDGLAHRKGVEHGDVSSARIDLPLLKVLGLRIL